MATVFSRIVSGEIPSYKVAEDDRFFAFLDINPRKPGHTLVIPKQETDYIFDLDDKTYLGLQSFAKKVAEGIKKAIPCKRVGVVVMGLEVPHAHIQLVTLQSETDLLNFHHKLKLEKEEFEAIREKIAASVSLY